MKDRRSAGLVHFSCVFILPIASAAFAAPSDEARVRLVNEFRSGLFRISDVDRGVPRLLGTAFCISRDKNHVFVATAAHVVEDSHGDIRPPNSLKVFHQSGHPMEIMEVFVHQSRKLNNGPDVAIVKLRPQGGLGNVTALPIAGQGTQRQLVTRPIGFVGFLSEAGFEREDVYSSGSVAVEKQDHGVNMIVYSLETSSGSSGAPIFLFEDRSQDGSDLHAFVVGIHKGVASGNLRHCVSAMHLHELVDALNVRQTSQVIIASDVDNNWQVIGQRADGPKPRPSTMTSQTLVNIGTTMKEVVDQSFQRRQQDSDDYNAAREYGLLNDAIGQHERIQSVIPWEAYCLRGVSATHLGIYYKSELKDQQNSEDYFRQADRDLRKAMADGGTQLLPRLLYGRVANNLGTPTLQQTPTAQQKEYLKWVHDDMKRLLNDANGQNLSDQEKAQCHYLLGYTHRFLVDGSPPQDDYRASIVTYPSQEAISHLRQLGSHTTAYTTNSIWNEFEQIYAMWSARTSSGCLTCN